MRTDFVKEMNRFLPAATIRDTIENPDYWIYLTSVLEDQGRKAIATISG